MEKKWCAISRDFRMHQIGHVRRTRVTSYICVPARETNHIQIGWNQLRFRAHCTRSQRHHQQTLQDNN